MAFDSPYPAQTSAHCDLARAVKRFASLDAANDETLALMREFIVARTRLNLTRFAQPCPTSTRDGRYAFAANGGWVGGFWSGLLHLAYEFSSDEALLEAARASAAPYLARLENQPETLDHDVGFLFTPSQVASYRLTGDLQAGSNALRAAELLAGRFNEPGRFIPCWNVWEPVRPFSLENRGRVIVDSLYNMLLLFWATETSGESRFADVAFAHIETCLEFLVREDFSTYHTYVFDPVGGGPKYGRTHQGYADESWWSRGQAWAIGGLAHAARYTGEQKFRDASRACAVAYLQQVEDNTIPRWDFRVPDPENHPLDSSAAAIAACGLLELGRVDPDSTELCEQFARVSVQRLWCQFATTDDEAQEGLLQHGCGHFPEGVDTDTSLIYGDYYWAEAVARLLGVSRGYW